MRLMLAAALTLALAGCGLVPDTETIAYHSLPGATIIPGAADTALTVTANDARGGNPRRFSNKKNAFGGTLAPILSDRPVADVVQAALTEELEHRGFRFGSGGNTVAVTVQRFSNDYDVGFFGADANGVATLLVEVRSPSGAVLYAHTVNGKGLEPSNQFMNGRNARTAMEGALSDAMRELMNDPTFFAALTRPASPGS